MGDTYGLGLRDRTNEGNLNFLGQPLLSNIALVFYHFVFCLIYGIMPGTELLHVVCEQRPDTTYGSSIVSPAPMSR
jgi:hypothetical protein